jgi:phenylalanyl-tRNA synthetase beta subunit
VRSAFSPVPLHRLGDTQFLHSVTTQMCGPCVCVCVCKCLQVRSYVTPDLVDHTFTASVKTMNSGIGIKLTADEVQALLPRMSLKCEQKSADELIVSVPATRPDVLHACDIMEDVAIAYGFSKLVPTVRDFFFTCVLEADCI